MGRAIFLHGVPDTAALWSPLLDALPEHRDRAVVLTLPGFGSQPPTGFVPSKEGYCDWLLREVQRVAREDGPVDLVGHDWGAILCLRAASLHPEWVRSWVISGALIHADYRGHPVAWMWNTPMLGELAMAMSARSLIRRVLTANGMPEGVARTEAGAWSPAMRRSILRLYRSARGLRFPSSWTGDLRNLPETGLALWGARDPFIRRSMAERFAREHRIPLRLHGMAGHWVVAEEADWCAEELRSFWDSLPAHG